MVGLWTYRAGSVSAQRSPCGYQKNALSDLGMGETGVKRKLAMILVADVEGYSRLMGANEEATLKTLGTYREIIDGLIARHANEPLCPEWWSAV